jgi:hypothetical protein
MMIERDRKLQLRTLQILCKVNCSTGLQSIDENCTDIPRPTKRLGLTMGYGFVVYLF